MFSSRIGHVSFLLSAAIRKSLTIGSQDIWAVKLKCPVSEGLRRNTLSLRHSQSNCHGH